MKFQLACGDVMPGCPTSFSAGSQEQLLGEVAAHAAQEHGITEITPEVAAAADVAVRSLAAAAAGMPLWRALGATSGVVRVASLVVGVLAWRTWRLLEARVSSLRTRTAA